MRIEKQLLTVAELHPALGYCLRSAPEKKELDGPECVFLWGRSATYGELFAFSMAKTFSALAVW